MVWLCFTKTWFYLFFTSTQTWSVFVLKCQKNKKGKQLLHINKTFLCPLILCIYHDSCLCFRLSLKERPASFLRRCCGAGCTVITASTRLWRRAEWRLPLQHRRTELTCSICFATEVTTRTETRRNLCYMTHLRLPSVPHQSWWGSALNTGY